MIQITFSSDEILAGVVVAANRKIHSDLRRARGAEPRNPSRLKRLATWDEEIESCLAEIAVARWSNRYWSGSFFRLETPGSDVGNGGQVRWTPHSPGNLIVYEDDPNDHAYVLVNGHSPIKNIIGWMLGGAAKEGHYWREDVECPSWWVPADHLRGVYDTSPR